MPTLFFVRSEVGFVPVFAEAGSIITPDMVEKHPSVPTRDQIDTLTIPQIKRLWNAMGKRLIKKTGKSAFLVFLMNNWEETMEHGFGIQREYHEYTTGTPVVMFWKTPEIFYTPFMVYPAEVIPISFFRNSQIEWNVLTPEMLNGLTKKQIVEIQVNVLDICPSGAREEKGNFIRDTVEAWDFQSRSFLENNIQNLSDEDEEASTSDGENSIHTIHNEADELSEIEEDEDIPNIEDFVLMTSEEGNETDPIVINDPSDFINDPFEVKVKEFGGRLLFRLIIQKGTMTVYEFKTSIVQTIQRRAVMKGIELDKVLKADDFKLIGDGKKLEETDPLKVNEVFIQLFIRGGGKSVISTIVRSVKKLDIYKEKSNEVFKKIENQNYESFAMKQAQNFSKHINTHGDKGDVIFQQAVSALSLDDAQKALRIIGAGGKNYGSTEDKLEKLCQMMCGKALGILDDETKKINDVRNSIICGMLSAYTGWCYKNGKFDNSALKSLLKEHIQRCERSTKDVEEDADMSFLTGLFSNSSI